jgi:hypothetical protein
MRTYAFMTHSGEELRRIERKKHNKEGKTRLLDAAHRLHLMPKQDGSYTCIADEHCHEEHYKVEEIHSSSLHEHHVSIWKVQVILFLYICLRLEVRYEVEEIDSSSLHEHHVSIWKVQVILFLYICLRLKVRGEVEEIDSSSLHWNC